MAKNNWSSDAFKKAQNLLSPRYNDKDTFEAVTTLSKDDAKSLARSMKLDMGVTGYGNTPFDDNQASMNSYFPSMNQDYQAETIPLSNDPYEMSPISRGNEQQGPRPGSEDYYVQNKREQILNGSYTPTTNEKNDPWLITRFMEDTKPQKSEYNMLDKVTDAWTNANTSREYFRNKGIEEARERASSTGTTMDDLKKLGSSLNPIQDAGAGIKEDFMDLFKKKDDKLNVADGMPQDTDNFRDLLKDMENSALEGFSKETGTWNPHESKEEGTDTIAYGHKLLPEEQEGGYIMIGDEPVPFEQMTMERADELLTQDWSKAQQGAEQWIGKGWNKLTEENKTLATELVFNMGLAKVSKGEYAFKRFKAKALVNAPDTISEIGRTYLDKKTGKRLTLGRVKDIKKYYKK